MGLENIEELLAKHIDAIVVCSNTEKVKHIVVLARLLGYNVVSWIEWVEKHVSPALIVTEDVEKIPLPVRTRFTVVTC